MIALSRPPHRRRHGVDVRCHRPHAQRSPVPNVRTKLFRCRARMHVVRPSNVSSFVVTNLLRRCVVQGSAQRKRAHVSARSLVVVRFALHHRPRKRNVVRDRRRLHRRRRNVARRYRRRRRSVARSRRQSRHLLRRRSRSVVRSSRRSVVRRRNRRSVVHVLSSLRVRVRVHVRSSRLFLRRWSWGRRGDVVPN